MTLSRTEVIFVLSNSTISVKVVSPTANLSNAISLTVLQQLTLAVADVDDKLTVFND